MKLIIKNMVGTSCKMVVKTELEKLNIPCVSIDLGEAEIMGSPTSTQWNTLKVSLRKYGLELVDERENALIEKIKNAIIEVVYHSQEPLKVNFSHYLSQKLNYNYTYLSNRFSESEGVTIEKLIISHKIEKVKELMAYNELTLTQIADKMNYKSVSHLSSQFKKVTGVTPSYYKANRDKLRVETESVTLNPAA
jgi:AraC-like DNA-binding protein